jgi:hypothetical protein
MQSIHPIDAREAKIAKIAESETDMAALQKDLKEIIEGTAFKGSHRSGQFLKFIVDQAIVGNFDSLKERMIGIELFGRLPSYNTGEDAIVRVTASDVRKRLLQHYGRYGTTSQFYISLPLGSYIPEIVHKCEITVPPAEAFDAEAVDSLHGPLTAHPDATQPSLTQPSHEALTVSAVHPIELVPESSPNRRLWVLFGSSLVILNLALWGIFWFHSTRRKPEPASVLPWSALFNPAHATLLITSDPNLVAIQRMTGTEISVSDYANRKYIPEPNKLTPEETRFFNLVLKGDNSAAAIDPLIAVNIAELAKTSFQRIEVHAARSIRLTDLKTDDNFIILGSPRSNPWFSLFTDQLDFVFAFDQSSGQEIIRNLHPRANESSVYVPTALGWATGQSYAVMALVQNPDQNGQVLLLAGANAEGTEAAGKLSVDQSRFAAALQKCGIDPSGPAKHFELLLRLNTMAGSPNNVDVVACHTLPGTAPQKP